MGKGDKRSGKGKLWKGTYGVNRPHKIKKAAPVAKVKAAAEAKPAKAKAAKKTKTA